MSYSDKELMSQIVEESGLKEMELLEFATYDVVSWGACRNCGCVSESNEPDASENWCDECNHNSVASVLVLAGII